MVARLDASPPLTGQLTLEAQALRRALGAPTQLDAREAGQTFLRLRAGRRARQPADVPAVERQLEWTEGLARYAEVGVARRAGQGSADPWQAFLSDLDQPARIRSGVRDRDALLGAAQGFVLDRLTPGWKAQALPGGAALETLVDRGVHHDRVPPALQGTRLMTLTLAAHRLRAAVADTPAAWRHGLRGVGELGTLDGLLFEFPQPGRGRFSGEGAGLALDVAFFAGDGHLLLKVRVPPCAAAPCPTSGIEQPFRWVLEAPAGSLDWVLAGARLQAAPEQAH